MARKARAAQPTSHQSGMTIRARPTILRVAIVTARADTIITALHARSARPKHRPVSSTCARALLNQIKPSQHKGWSSSLAVAARRAQPYAHAFTCRRPDASRACTAPSNTCAPISWSNRASLALPPPKLCLHPRCTLPRRVAYARGAAAARVREPPPPCVSPQSGAMTGAASERQDLLCPQRCARRIQQRRAARLSGDADARAVLVTSTAPCVTISWSVCAHRTCMHMHRIRHAAPSTTAHQAVLVQETCPLCRDTVAHPAHPVVRLLPQPRAAGSHRAARCTLADHT